MVNQGLRSTPPERVRAYCREIDAAVAGFDGDAVALVKAVGLAVGGIEAACDQGDRCPALVEVGRDTYAGCALKIGHEGPHKPPEPPKQTASDGP